MAAIEIDELDTTLEKPSLGTPGIQQALKNIEDREADPTDTYGLPTDVDSGLMPEQEEEEVFLPGQNPIVEETYEYANGVVTSLPLVAGTGSAIAPVSAAITSPYTGGRRDTGGHGGVDYNVSAGTPVRSPMNGVVENVVNVGNASYGLYIVVRFPDNHLGYFAHLSGANVRPGQRVEAGQVIGQSGNSGRSTGDHLHFEIRNPAGATIDPLGWLSSSAASVQQQSAARAPRPSGGSLDYGQLKSVAQQAGFNSRDAGIMAAIAIGESGGVPTAYNGKGLDDSYGLWQFNLRYDQNEINRRLAGAGARQRSDLYDPLVNARAAYWLWRQQGFGAWTIYNNGSWRKHWRG